jgi:hypothetical protein
LKVGSAFFFFGAIAHAVLFDHQPYDLHALLEAHVNSGFSSDGMFPRSSVLRVLKAKALSGSSLTQYQVEISTGALGLQVKPGLRDASAFPSATLMCTWIPASVIDYALPDLASRSKSVANLKRKAKHSRKKPSASPARLHTVASTVSAPVGGPSGMFCTSYICSRS